MKKEILIEIISFLFILLFVYASVSKLFDYQKFIVQTGQSPLLTGFGSLIPNLVIAVELLISVLMATSRLKLIAMYAAFSLMVMFTAYITAMLNFSSFVPCSCGGVLAKLGWEAHLVFNIGFVLLALTGIVLQTAIRYPSTTIASTNDGQTL